MKILDGFKWFFDNLSTIGDAIATVSVLLFAAEKITHKGVAHWPNSRFWKWADNVMAGGGGFASRIVGLLDAIALNRSGRRQKGI